MTRWVGIIVGMYVLACTRLPVAAKDGPRYPLDIVVDDDARRAFTANSHSASVSCVDLVGGEVLDEEQLPPGSRPSRIAMSSGSDGTIHLAVSLRHHHEIALLRWRGTAIRLLGRVEVGRLPGGLAFDKTGNRVLVACEGADSVFEVDVSTRRVVRRLETIDAPRHIAFTADPKTGAAYLVVAGRDGVALIDPVGGKRLGSRSLAAGTALNIGGLAMDGDRVILAHQVQPTEVTISPQMIVWGLIIANRVSGVRLTEILGHESAGITSETSTRTGGAAPARKEGYDVDLGVGGEDEWIVPLDQRHRANGDPGRVALVPGSRTLLVPSGGTDRLLLVDLEDGWRRITQPLTTEQPVASVVVGDRPVTVVAGPRGNLAYVLCSLDDRIDIVDTRRRRLLRSLRLRPQAAPTTEHLGASIFFDSRRSRGGWYSCHSCHPEGGTRGRRFDTSSDGDGLAKRAPALHGVTGTGPWSWAGGFETLEAQVAATLEKTMAVDSPPGRREVEQVIAFLRTLEPPRPTRPGESLGGDTSRGKHLFAQAACTGCHRPPGFTTRKISNVGVVDDYDGRGDYNPPSLRGVRDRERWLHDGRAATLRAVFRDHDPDRLHGRAHELSADELADLLAYLKTL